MAIKDCFDDLNWNKCPDMMAVTNATGMSDLVTADYMHSLCSYKNISDNLNPILFSSEGAIVNNVEFLLEFKALRDRKRNNNTKESKMKDTNLKRIKRRLITNIIDYYKSVAADEGTGLEFIKRILRKTFKDHIENLIFIIDELKRIFDVLHVIEENKRTRIAEDDPQSTYHSRLCNAHNTWPTSDDIQNDRRTVIKNNDIDSTPSNITDTSPVN
ncbi:hypothetical protein RF11_13474 [Thelohanellus kitauei]|uniref:Uncharacterized protein n=1 Tax=Thelohanellus kitauei TaxID=669202 RepID=A0A0C2J7Y2_THEKT|nr:hypothetical protein RF11_13474 [Thelohanellus kitauei]